MTTTAKPISQRQAAKRLLKNDPELKGKAFADGLRTEFGIDLTGKAASSLRWLTLQDLETARCNEALRSQSNSPEAAKDLEFTLFKITGAKTWEELLNGPWEQWIRNRAERLAKTLGRPETIQPLPWN